MPRKVLRSPRLVKKKRQQKVKMAVLLSLLSIFIVGLAFYALLQPEFRIARITVDGAESAPLEAVERLLEESLMGTFAGLIPRSHIAFFPKRSIEEALRETFPVFSDVSVRRDGLAAIRVSLISRDPHAIWCTGGECHYIDESGFAFAPASAQSDSEYYRIDADAASTTPLGTTVVEQGRLSELISLARDVDRLSPELASLSIGEDGRVTAHLASGTRLLFGQGDFGEAISRLERTLSEEGLVPRRNGQLLVSYIDLRYGNKIYFK